MFVYVIGLYAEWISEDNEAGFWGLGPLRDIAECVCEKTWELYSIVRFHGSQCLIFHLCF